MPHNGGRLIANSSGGFGEQFMFLNAIKGSLSGLVAGTTTDNGWGQLINAQGYPKQMPIGAGAFWTWGQTRIYGASGDKWDLHFPSQHTLTIASNEIDVSSASIGAGHLRATITEAAPYTTYNGKSSNCALTRVRITAMSGSDWTGGVILCAYQLGGVVVDHKALIDAGEIFDPLWIETLGYTA